MYRSRLEKREEKKNLKKAAWILLGVAVFSLAAAIAGFPLLIRFAVFIGELNSSRELVVKTDIIPPAPPRLSSPYIATNSATINISGTSEPGARIYLAKNDQPTGSTVADDSGWFRFLEVKLDRGENKFKAVAMDSAGNSSQPSAELKILHSDKQPSLNIETPKENQEFKGERLIEFKGKTEPGVQLTLNDRVVLVRNDGSFHTKIELADGENLLKITAIDKTGNVLNREITVRYSPF